MGGLRYECSRVLRRQCQFFYSNKLFYVRSVDILHAWKHYEYVRGGTKIQQCMCQSSYFLYNKEGNERGVHQLLILSVLRTTVLSQQHHSSMFATKVFMVIITMASLKQHHITTMAFTSKISKRSLSALGFHQFSSPCRTNLNSLQHPHSQNCPSLHPFHSITNDKILISARHMSNAINSETKHAKMKSPSEKDIQIVQNMLYRIRECNHVPIDVKRNLMDFVVDGEKVGKVTKSVANLLSNSIPPGQSEQVFHIVESNDEDRGGSNRMVLSLTKEAGDTLEKRTDSVMNVMEYLREKGIIQGWRDELYPLAKGFYDEPVLLVERAAAPFLGMQQYGVHICGIVRDDKNGEEKMWVARRSKTKSKYPGMLDHIVAGGQPAGLSLMENVVKECAEEAGVSEELTLAGIQAAGAVSYETFEPSNCDDYDGIITRALLFNYDLYLPNDFMPKVVDGEVEEFFTWTIDDILSSMDKDYKDPIKPNCYLVIIDFLLRKGYLSPEVPGYLDILKELRGGHCG